MGKRIIQQARGKGSLTYRTRKKAFRVTIGYPSGEGEARVLKLLNVPCYSAPVAKIMINKKIFYNIAAQGIYEGKKIGVGKKDLITEGSILKLREIPVGTSVFCIESSPSSGPKFVRASGLSGRITKKEEDKVLVLMPSKEEKEFNQDIRATIGAVAGGGRMDKPLLKAGKKFHMKRAIGGRIYPRTSAVKMNVIDHPFGSGRGKRIKQKIAKRNAPPGKKVGLLRPRRTGRLKKK